MEQYMKKKRMKNKVRNDYDNGEYFEDNIYDDLNAKNLYMKKYAKLGFIGAGVVLLILFCLINRRKVGSSPILKTDYVEEFEADIGIYNEDSDSEESNHGLYFL